MQYFDDFSVEIPPRTLLRIFKGYNRRGRVRQATLPDDESMLDSYFNESIDETVCLNVYKSDDLYDEE